MHGGFGGGGGGGGFGHSGGGGGGFSHGGGGHSGVSGHMASGHEHNMAHNGGHAAHAEHHHHHGGGNKDDKKAHAAKGGQAQSHGQNQGHGQSQGQSTLSHLTSLVQNGHGVLGHIAAALTGHNATSGHNAGAGQSMHLNSYLSPLQAEKKDSSDQVGNSGALSHPDNLVQEGMVSRRTHSEPRILLAAIFAGLLIWMLVVQVFSGGPPVKHKRVTAVTPKGRPLTTEEIASGADPEREMAQSSSVAPILSLLSMAESHKGPSGIGQVLRDDPNSDPNEATQTDDAQVRNDRERQEKEELAERERRSAQDQGDVQGENSESASNSTDNSAQIAAAMQLFQRRPENGPSPVTQSAMVAPTPTVSAPQMAMNARSPLRAVSSGGHVSARMTARPMGNPRTVTTDGPAPVARPVTSNLLQAETLQKGAQATFAAGTFGGPRALSPDEAILIGAQPKVPGASSILRVQKPGSQIVQTPAPQLISSANTGANTGAHEESASFANLFVPSSANVVKPAPQVAAAAATRRRWKSSQAPVGRSISSARNSTIADASIYTNSPVDESGHSRKRVLTDR